MRRKNILKSCMLSLFLFSVLHSLVFLPFFFSPYSLLANRHLPSPWGFNETFFQFYYFVSLAVCMVSGLYFIFIVLLGKEKLINGIILKEMLYTGGSASALQLYSISQYLNGGSYYYAEYPENVVDVDTYYSFFISLQSLPEILFEFVCIILSVSALLVFLVVDGKAFLRSVAEVSQRSPQISTIVLFLAVFLAGLKIIWVSGSIWGSTSFLFFEPSAIKASATIIFPEQNSPEQYRAMVLAYIIIELSVLLLLTLASSAFALWMRGMLNKKHFVKQAIVLMLPAVLLLGAEMVATISALAPNTRDASALFRFTVYHFPAINVYVMFLALLASSILLCRNAGKEKLGYTAKAEMQ